MNTKIINIAKISAIYYALLQNGYDYYVMEKETSTLADIENFRVTSNIKKNYWFRDSKQDTCEPYPYWPRVAVLETATFFIENHKFLDFDAYYKYIMTASNISEVERNRDFWLWVEKFPRELESVLSSNDFKEYINWENAWIVRQNEKYREELKLCSGIVEFFIKHYETPVQNLSIVLNPIKCAYSADYFLNVNTLFYISGAFSSEAVIHEFLHSIVHPVIETYKSEIIARNFSHLGIDSSYFLDGGDNGKLNAFEEHFVRALTIAVLSGERPLEIGLSLAKCLRQF
jgi:hypothetical protein